MIRVLLLLSAFTPHPASDEDVQSKQDILADRRYRFCHEDDYPLVESERSFCSLISPDDKSCPSLAKACQREPQEIEESSSSPIETKIEPGSRAPSGRKSGEDERSGVRRIKKSQEEKGASDGEKPKNPDKPTGQEATPNPTTDKTSTPTPDETPKSDPEVSTPPPPPPPKPDPEKASMATGIARILFFGLLAAFIAYIVRMIIKNVLADSDAPPDDAPADEPVAAAQAQAKPAMRGPIETDVERLLARARAAAQKGAFAQAIDDLYAALLRRLDGDGIINIQPFRTNGDYLREVRRERSEIAPDVRAILSDVESVHFGSRSPSAEIFSRIHDRVVPLVTKALGVVFFIVAISTVTSCAHIAASDLDESDEDGLTSNEAFRGDSSPSGIHAIVTLLEPVGVDMRQHRRPLEDLPDPGISTLVLLPDFDIDDIGARRLHDWVKEGGHLVFAGGSQIPEWAGAAAETEQTSKSPAKPAPGQTYYFGDISMPLPLGPLLRCESFEMLLTRDSLCYAAQRKIEKGEVFVFADDRWFMNIALPMGDNASFLLSFFTAAHHKVHVLDGQTSMGANTPIDSITQSHLWPVILQLFFLLGLAFLWRGRAFGTLRDPKVETRRAFSDHVRALGLAYARSGASRHVLGIYAGWAIERLRERLPREGRRGLSGLAEALAVRTGKSTGEVMSALVDLTDAHKETAPMSQRSVVAPTRASRKDKNQAAADFNLFRIIDQWLALTSRERTKTSARSVDKKTKRSS